MVRGNLAISCKFRVLSGALIGLDLKFVILAGIERYGQFRVTSSTCNWLFLISMQQCIDRIYNWENTAASNYSKALSSSELARPVPAGS